MLNAVRTGVGAAGDFVVAVAYTPFAEMLIWVGTLFGGIIFTGANGHLPTQVFALVIVTLAVSPLALKGTIEWRSRRRDEVLDGREATAAQFGTVVLQDAADLELSNRADRVAMAENWINEALDHVWANYFSANKRVRVLFYDINSARTALTMNTRYPPRGRDHAAPRPFDAGEDTRGSTALARFESPKPFHYVADTSVMSDQEFGDTTRPYATFIAVPIRATSEAFGMLTVDSTRASDLDERDGPALEIYANAIAFYLAAERRGRQNRGGTEAP
ncbi:GAF domain-containing protein [Microbacterium enclense]|uniref:GAF domain-containing protein n=1 Tax=Microbacterium enclense TaxID=993073 RepID=A0A1G6IC37_9MICO|nr:GAF domain-containing protein [Microbacterium enclense]KSU55009.1 hypothetical protein AS029_06050 [Microbacterium enclense]SDC04054.1 GAF domain-containing protein [Microbacterium enclense]